MFEKRLFVLGSLLDLSVTPLVVAEIGADGGLGVWRELASLPERRREFAAVGIVTRP